MNRIIALISVAAFVSIVQVRAGAPVATPEDCIWSFYHWYVTNLVANRDPMKQGTEMRRYATERLLREISKMEKGPNGLDGDYFVDAQDFDPLWAKKISVSAVQIQGDKSNAHVLLDGAKGMQKKLLVHLVKEAGTWKVDKVQGQDGG